MKLNLESIKERLERLELYIEELKKRQDLKLEEYKKDTATQLIVERAFQAAIESCADIASHLVSVYGLGRPEDQKDLFPILAKSGYLDTHYAEQMKEMVKLRNRIVHLYWDIDVERMHQYLQEDVALLEKFKQFTLQLIEAEEERGKKGNS